MKQIKTIAIRMNNAEEFDKRVNTAIAEGWTLTKRRVLQPRAQPAVNEIFHTMLYAELEKFTGGKAEEARRCENCAHVHNIPNFEPCTSCNTRTHSHWEPEEGDDHA